MVATDLTRYMDPKGNRRSTKCPHVYKTGVGAKLHIWGKYVNENTSGIFNVPWVYFKPSSPVTLLPFKLKADPKEEACELPALLSERIPDEENKDKIYY